MKMVTQKTYCNFWKLKKTLYKRLNFIYAVIAKTSDLFWIQISETWNVHSLFQPKVFKTSRSVYAVRFAHKNMRTVQKSVYAFLPSVYAEWPVAPSLLRLIMHSFQRSIWSCQEMPRILEAHDCQRKSTV